MTEHLRQDEFVDAIEHALDAARQRHVDECVECQASLTELQRTLQEARGVDMPEPSPLFWDHFSDRVRQATDLESTPGTARNWWQVSWWRPIGILASAVAAALLIVVMRPAPADPTEPAVEVAALVTPPDDGSWGLVMGLASELDATDVREVAKPAEGTADAMIAELTAEQRRALVKLLKAEIGEQ